MLLRIRFCLFGLYLFYELQNLHLEKSQENLIKKSMLVICEKDDKISFIIIVEK